MITLNNYLRSRRLFFIISVLFVLSTIILIDTTQNHFSSSQNDKIEAVEKKVTMTEYGKIPLYFEPNLGQVNDQVRFLARGRGYSLFLTQSEAVLKLQIDEVANKSNNTESIITNDKVKKVSANSTVLNMKIIGSNPKSKIIGLDKLSGKSNYFIGNDPKNWRTDVSNYAKVQYQDIYSGIDLIYYGNQQQLEYDFVVAPGVDPGTIKLGFEGAKDMNIDDGGNLILGTDGGEVILRSPVLYQDRNNVKQTILGGYELDDELQVCFNVSDYDKSKPLVIDPELVYSTYLGGNQGDGGKGISLDSQGNVYVTGETISLDFPTVNSYQSNFRGGSPTGDVFITKMNTEGSEIIYSTYLGGENWDEITEIGVDAEGLAVIIGRTASENFPVIAAVQSALADTTETHMVDDFGFYVDGDVFITKLSQQGNALVYSTYLGSWEGDIPVDLAVTSDGKAYVTGSTSSYDTLQTVFPLTPGSYKDNISKDHEIFVTAFSPAGNLIYSTLLGEPFSIGNEGGIAVNSVGNTYILDYDLTETCGNGEIAVIILNTTGTALVDSITFCASGIGTDIALDSKNNIYITGYTSGVGWGPAFSIPITDNAFQPSYGGGYQDAFIVKLNPQGSILYASYLGGSGEFEMGSEIVVVEDDIVYVTGFTYSNDFPTKNAVQDEFGGEGDAFISHFDLSKNGSESLIYSTFLGGSADDDGCGIAADANGNAYITGSTASSDFPIKNAYQFTINGPGDAFVCKIGSGIVNLIYDKVVIGGPPVFPPLLSPATQQILPQFVINSPEDTVYFTFVGRQTDSRVGLRVINTRFGFAPLYLDLAVFDPVLGYIPPFTIHNIGIGNAGMQFDVINDGIYTIKVWAKSDSPGPFPSPFQIHLAGNVGLPRKQYFEPPSVEPERATRQDILFNHPAPRPQLLLGTQTLLEGDVEVAQTALFKFTNIASVSQNAVAVLIPTTDLGFPQGTAPIRAIDPNPMLDITTPTARTLQTTNLQRGIIIDFTQVPIPASIIIPPQLGIAAVLGIRDQISAALPINTNTGDVYSIILDMGSGQEIVDGDGNDFRIYASEGSYNAAVSNTPFQDTFIPIGSAVSGDNDFELAATGLTSARYVRITAAPSVMVDAVKALNVFADEVRENIGALAKVSYTTITMRRSKAPETPIDPFLELIAPDGARMAANESGFGDDLSLVLSDAALINMELNQEGFYRFLGRGYDVRPEDASVGSFYVRLESAGDYDQTEITISEGNENSTSPQKEGHIMSKRQRDSYLFQASPGQSVNIVVYAKNGNLNPMIELYDPEDFLIGANDDAPGRGRNSLLSITLPTTSFVGQDELPDPSTYRIVISAIDDIGSQSPITEKFAYFRTAANGEYELKVFTAITDVDTDNQGAPVPETFELKQNYPNPFNPTTTIKYEIPRPSSVGKQVRNDNINVQLKIYDILGREVAAIVNEQQKAGYYEVRLDAPHLTNGVYFYRIQAGDFIDTKKMILLK